MFQQLTNWMLHSMLPIYKVHTDRWHFFISTCSLIHGGNMGPRNTAGWQPNMFSGPRPYCLLTGMSWSTPRPKRCPQLFSLLCFDRPNLLFLLLCWFLQQLLAHWHPCFFYNGFKQQTLLSGLCLPAYSRLHTTLNT